MSILILFPFLIIIVFFIKFGKTTRKATHWILSIYLAVLVIATLFVPFITDNSMSHKKVDQLEVDQEWNKIDTKLSQGQIEQVDPQYLLMENSFNVEHLKTLQIRSSKEDSLRVIVERKEGSDKKMDAFVFRKGLIIDDYDFSDQLKPYRLELVDQTLRIMSSQQKIDLALSSNPFPVRQFTGESIRMGHSSTHGEQVIYLRIPQDLELVGDARIHLQYIEG